MPIRTAARLMRVMALLVGVAGVAGVSAQTITVSAASSLQEAMRELGKAFAVDHPGTQVSFNFAASGVLLAQIAQGAPVDVYASADLDTMDRAQHQRLIDPGSRANFAANQLVLISPAGRAQRLSTLHDLAKPNIRHIALGNVATVPAGRYARDALTTQGLWSPLAAKLVFAENVRQVLTYVGRAEADAGFVYRSDALHGASKVRIDVVLDSLPPLLYPIARVAASTQPRMADQFIAFVRSPQAQAVFARHGFSAP